MLNSILSYDIKIIFKSQFCHKKVIIWHYVCNVVMDVITFPKSLKTMNCLSILLHGVISLPDTTSYDKCSFGNCHFNPFKPFGISNSYQLDQSFLF